MRQRLEQKQHEQEQNEKNQETLVESRRSKVSKSSIRLGEGSESRPPEKVILLTKGTKIPWSNISSKHGGYKANSLREAAQKLQIEGLGQLSKERINGAHKATTYFTKTQVNPNSDPKIVTDFINKLAKYNVSFQNYLLSFETEAAVTNTEIESNSDTDVDDNTMDLSPSVEDNTLSPPPPAIPPRFPVVTAASGNINMGFLTPQPPRNSKTAQFFNTQASNINATSSISSPQRHAPLVVSQYRKKNRIEPIALPNSLFASPLKHTPLQSQEYPIQSQEYPYRSQ
ncbi:unnamed protein product [Adineta steineri]|uniref:Uncharacterized protein n=1 Tax=Adineta steineri TaxID=433720 RepID=A0A814JJP7_9BILA|nr:unnamed protein product [Adineta steineri]CAF1265181.1 unnamed protein product [Adineta steineri]